MTVSDDYLAFIEDQLADLPELTHQRLSGGVGLYSEGLFFGILDEDTLYLKVSDLPRSDLEKLGAGELDSQHDPDLSLRGYYQVLPRIVQDRDALLVWAEKAVEAARAAARADRGGKGTR